MKMLPSNQFDGSMMNAHVNKELLGPPPLSVTKGLHNAPSKIFVSIAAYRDSEIAPTLLSLMTTAQHSDRIFVGLVLQIDTITTQNNEDEQIVDSLQQLALTTPWYNTHVRTMTLDARHAQGPCYARYLCQSLHRGEDYVLQIDSHMRFRNNWDTFLIEQLQTCSLIHKNNNKNKVMLTTYPVGYQLPNLIPNECRATLLVPWKFDAQGMLRQQGRLLLSLSESSNPKDPIPCLLYAAGFNFTYASVLDDCPYQMLPHLFFGEELSMALRLYTWGYDLYAPSESVCYHLWSRAHRPTSPLLAVGETEADKQAARDRSQRIVKEQLAGRGPGLGSERCAHEFAKALKVDFEKHRLEEGAGLGGMSISSFVASEVIASADKLEKSVFQLERNAQSLIASFLKQLE
jgi:[Skp1-protein]-hydroxyproline N-acetylglucosaminyltransferase